MYMSSPSAIWAQIVCRDRESRRPRGRLVTTHLLVTLLGLVRCALNEQFEDGCGDIRSEEWLAWKVLCFYIEVISVQINRWVKCMHSSRAIVSFENQ